jgi:hypothetical protein
MSPTAAAYLAGFIDGEGTIGIIRARRRENKSGYRLQPYLSVANTDKPALEAIQAMCGNGRLVQQTNPVNANHKDGYSLRFSPNQIRHLLPQLQPYLLIKAKQAGYVLEFLSVNRGGRHLKPEEQQKTDELRESVRALNARGVPLTH